ncbi:hypothetical protein DV515_00018833, partial [Chloebia gouldiae]
MDHHNHHRDHHVHPRNLHDHPRDHILHPMDHHDHSRDHHDQLWDHHDHHRDHHDQLWDHHHNPRYHHDHSRDHHDQLWDHLLHPMDHHDHHMDHLLHLRDRPNHSRTTPTTSGTSTTTQRTSTAMSTTPGTTPTTLWTTAAPPSGLCENGGTPGGTGCLCSPSYAGPRCEFSTDTVETNLPFPGTIMATVDMEVTVTNFNYSEDLKDPTSETFLSFQNHFRQEIKKIYGTIPGYEGVEITSLKSGSIVVGHEVFFTMAQSSNTTEKFQETTEGLKKNLHKAEASQGSCQHNTSVLCLVVRQNPVVSDMREVLDLDELCHQRAPPGYGASFTAAVTAGVLHCVTSCTPNLPQSLDCHHGRCHVTREGPRCFCPDEDLYWYAGAQCSGRVSKVATGLGVVVALLFLICLILIVVLLSRRHRR